MESPYNLDSQLKLFARRPNNFQPNVITESKQTFSELEKKIVLLVTNQLGDISLRNQYEEGKNIKFQIPLTELTETNHAKVIEAADQLSDRSYYNRDNPGIDKMKPFPRVTSLMISGKRYLEITMLADIVPLFIGLGQRYTKYNLSVMLSLNSVYAQRIYEIAMMFKNRGQNTFQYSVEKLIYMLNCPPSYTYKELNRWALTIAQKEIERKTGIMIDFRPSKKAGRRILELTFEVLTQEGLAAKLVEEDRQIVNGMSINEAIVTAWQLFKQYSFKSWQKELIASEFELLSKFFQLHSEIENGLRVDVNKPTAYIIRSLSIESKSSPGYQAKTKPKKSVSAKNQPNSLGSIMGAMNLFE